MPQTHRRHFAQIDPADEQGQTMTEYSLLVALIAVTVAVAVPAVGSAVSGLIGQASAFFGG